MSYLNEKKKKNALTPILQSYGLNDIVINQLLSDIFTDRAFELLQKNP